MSSSVAHMFSQSVRLCSTLTVMTQPFILAYCKDSLTLTLTSHLVFHEAKLSWLQISRVPLRQTECWRHSHGTLSSSSE
ncbi:uncharacterized [Tachysurus ichikawai]